VIATKSARRNYGVSDLEANMRVATIHGPGDVRVELRSEPVVMRASDAIVQVSASCICGSDLWSYRGQDSFREGDPIGHEAVGLVAEIGDEVVNFKAGDFVVVPFCHCDNTCPHCKAGMQSNCQNLEFTNGGQADCVRVAHADGTLIKITPAPPDELVPSLLALSDVMATGWHSAVSARVHKGDTAVVVGDGAVGLCAVIAARQLGASRIIAMSRHEDRQRLATTFGATDVVEARGAEGIQQVRKLTGGLGADAVLECVGTHDAMTTAISIARPGSTVGMVGIPHEVDLPLRDVFYRSVNLAGGLAPAQRYLPELLALVTSGTINPGLVFDMDLPLGAVADGYRAMHLRQAIKVLLRP
jgi:threonine dehydrogenase-like Zn-dependent dehydrogenase